MKQMPDRRTSLPNFRTDDAYQTLQEGLEERLSRLPGLKSDGVGRGPERASKGEAGKCSQGADRGEGAGRVGEGAEPLCSIQITDENGRERMLSDRTEPRFSTNTQTSLLSDIENAQPTKQFIVVTIFAILTITMIIMLPYL